MSIFRHKAVLVALILLMMAVVGRWWQSERASRSGTVVTPVTVSDSALSYVIVQIDGAVHRPGVYRITSDAHVMDLVFLAGGLLPDARLGKTNLAKVLEDGDRIHVLGAIKPKAKSTKRRKKVTNG